MNRPALTATTILLLLAGTASVFGQTPVVPVGKCASLNCPEIAAALPDTGVVTTATGDFITSSLLESHPIIIELTARGDFRIQDWDGNIIMHCASHGKYDVRHCRVTKGHTLDQAISIVVRTLTGNMTAPHDPKGVKP